MAEDGKKPEDKKLEDKELPDANKDDAGEEGDQGGEEDNAPAELTSTEQAASLQGWVPLSEWKGDPKEHRSAREFIDRGELLGKIKSQSQEIQAVTKIVQHLSEHNKMVYQAGIEAGIKQLKEQRKEAIREQDADALAEIEDKLDDRRQELAQVKAAPVPQVPKQVGASPEFQAFLSRNQWYLGQASKRHWAHGVAIEFAKDNQNLTEAQVYAYVEQEARKEFPDLFKSKREAPPSPDGESRRNAGGGKDKGNSKAFEDLIATMPEDQARVAKDMVKRGFVTKEKYVEDYLSVGGR